MRVVWLNRVLELAGKELVIFIDEGTRFWVGEVSAIRTAIV